MVFRYLIFCAVLLLPTAALADVKWQFSKQEGRPYLHGLPDEEESDTVIWMVCRADGSIDIGVGAEPNVGEGKGEAVALTLTSGSAVAKLAGRSQNSPNFEMTGGTELRTQIKRDDALFAVLASGKPIAVSGSIKATTTWPVKGLKAKVASFLQACK